MRGRETSMCGCLSCAPNWGPGPQPRHVSRLGIKLVTLWFTGWHSIHWATPVRASLFLFSFKRFFFSREKEGEKQIGCLLHTPNWGPGPQRRHMPWLGIEPANFQSSGWHSIHWATPARTSFIKVTVPRQAYKALCCLPPPPLSCLTLSYIPLLPQLQPHYTGWTLCRSTEYMSGPSSLSICTSYSSR